MIITVIMTILLSGIDKILEYYNILGRYYFNHFLINFIVVYYTYNDMLLCYTDLFNLHKYELNIMPVELTFSIHFYHILIYYNKFLFDDWLHHIIMIFFCLPMGIYINNSPLMYHCLFFLSGLPGGINYFLLFLQRNCLISKKLQKQINYFLNLCIRNPGCLFSALFGYLYYINYLQYLNDNLYFYFMIFVSTSNYWNGVYFMEQVVRNYNLLYPTV
tara:strand:+ start:6756 stop:7406 length:651 start_codon:yes stop_codon:yes gene_type:complete